MKCMRRMANHTWQDYRTNEFILSEFKIRPVVKKIQTYRNKWIQTIRRMDRDRQTATIKYEWEKIRRTKHEKIFRLVTKTEQVTRPKILQEIRRRRRRRRRPWCWCWWNLPFERACNSEWLPRQSCLNLQVQNHCEW
jgi:predicted transcriptional regulator